jgi:hypothetical protein
MITPSRVVSVGERIILDGVKILAGMRSSEIIRVQGFRVPPTKVA